MPNRVIEDGRVPRRVGLDKRMRLTAEQRQEIRENAEGLSNHKLAEKYGVSKRLVQFIRHPERHAKNLQDRHDRGGSKRYYDVDKHREAMQAHREHKRELLTRGELSASLGASAQIERENQPTTSDTAPMRAAEDVGISVKGL